MLDTNICIHLMQKQPKALLARFDDLNAGDVVISAISYAELCAGVERRANERALAARVLRNFIKEVPVLSFDEHSAEEFGRLRAAVPDRRRDALDRLIAAHAVAQNLVLITNNEADFRDYPDLRLENWAANPH